MSKELYDLTWEWAEEMKEKNITMRGFVPMQETLNDYRQADKKYGRELRKLAYDDYSSETTLETMGNFVQIIDLSRDSQQAIIIENKRAAKMIKLIFEMMWKLTEKK